MTNEELLDLLREAREYVGFCPFDPDSMNTAGAIRDRIDAALAEANPCRLIDVGDGGMSKERLEADAFRRGAEAMREAAAQHFAAPTPFDYIAPLIRALPLPKESK